VVRVALDWSDPEPGLFAEAIGGVRAAQRGRFGAAVYAGWWQARVEGSTTTPRAEATHRWVRPTEAARLARLLSHGVSTTPTASRWTCPNLPLVGEVCPTLDRHQAAGAL